MQHIFSFALIFLQQFSLPISFWHPFGLQFAWSNKNDGLTLSCVHKNLSSLMQYHLGLQFAWPNSLLPDAQGNWRSDSNLCFLKTCKVDLVILHSTLPLICCMSFTRLYLYHLSIKITLGQDTRHTRDRTEDTRHKKQDTRPTIPAKFTLSYVLHSTFSYSCLITFIGTLKMEYIAHIAVCLKLWHSWRDRIALRKFFGKQVRGSGSRLYICISIKITLEQALLGTYIWWNCNIKWFLIL